MDNAIEARGLEKTYRGDVRALKGVSLAAAEGTVFGLLGPNGAGKSTTVKILTTLSAPDAGEAYVAGYNVVKQPGKVRLAIGSVAQKSGLHAHGLAGAVHGGLHLAGDARLPRVPAVDLTVTGGSPSSRRQMSDGPGRRASRPVSNSR